MAQSLNNMVRGEADIRVQHCTRIIDLSIATTSPTRRHLKSKPLIHTPARCQFGPDRLPRFWTPKRPRMAIPNRARDEGSGTT